MLWCRLYGAMIDNPKVGTLTHEQHRLWTEILCLACQSENEGDTNLTISEAEWKLRRNISLPIKELIARNLVTLRKHTLNDTETLRNNSETNMQHDMAVTTTFQEQHTAVSGTSQSGRDTRETIYVTNWNKRQFKSDSSTPRVQKHRDRHKSNDTETF